jgi:phenylpropionate dioxygenase-like ring-hydroxylating dioxygenase large terminal subunit
MLHRVDAPEGWLLVAPLAELEAEGAVVTLDVGRERLLVVRGQELRAFHNVCQHRGHPLVDGACRRQRLRCPYHGWIYALDGRLEHVPDRESFGDLEGVALRTVDLALRAPFAWVRLAGDDAVPDDFDRLAGFAIADRLEAPIEAAPPPQIGANTIVQGGDDGGVGRLAVTATGCQLTAWRFVAPGEPPAPSPPLLARLGLA